MNKRYQPLPPEFFSNNRNQFAKQMLSDSMAIFFSNDLMPRSGDAMYPFRQNSALYYLCGIDQPETVLLLFPDTTKNGFNEVLFIRKTDEFIKIWEGHQYSKDEAAKISGVDKVFWTEDLDRILHELILMAKCIYLNGQEQDNYPPEIIAGNDRKGREIQNRYPFHRYERAQPILKKLTVIKHTEEVAMIQRAVDIAAKGFQEVLTHVRPGLYEYQLEALLTGSFIAAGASGHAFEPIIASGADGCVLHYTQNNKLLKSGDLILMDFGAEYGGYNSDISRTVPVNGRFSTRQRQVYDAVKRVLMESKALLVPGILMQEYQTEAGKIMRSALLSLGLPVQQGDDYKKYFMHSMSHHLGLDVHDAGSRYAPLEAGMVLTVEPGIYIREEGIGIRLENDVVIKDSGVIDLCREIPLEAEEIEDLIQRFNPSHQK
jgi:Xaa-Pro aminopeptidase